MIVVVMNFMFFFVWGFFDLCSNYVGWCLLFILEQIDNVLIFWNLSDIVLLIEWWWNWFMSIVLCWDWGVSLIGQLVNEQVVYCMWVSVEFVFGVMIIVVVFGIWFGVYIVFCQYKFVDCIGQVILIIMMNINIIVVVFVVVFFVIVFNEVIGVCIFYVIGFFSFGVIGFFFMIVDVFQYVMFLMIVFVFVGYVQYYFLQCLLLLDNINVDYVCMVCVKGLIKVQVVCKYVLWILFIFVVMQVVFMILMIFIGVILIELIFVWQGMGCYFFDIINQNDINGVVVVVVFGVVLIVIGVVFVDIVVVVFDL